MSAQRTFVNGHPFIPYRLPRRPHDEMISAVRSFADELHLRRSVRHFSPDPIPVEAVREAIRAATSAPSGAHFQPWRFVLVTNPDVRRRIRIAAEEEEQENYGGRMPEDWRRVLEPLQTDWHKEFLEIAPALIVVFKVDWHEQDSVKVRHYYVNESVGLACGMLLAALHRAGLAALTHTPSPMGFLREILDRPVNEKPFLLIPVGWPADDARVPDIHRRPLEELLVEID